MLVNLLFLLLAAGFYKLILYPLFLSPLAKIPNAHPLSPLTSLWMHWSRFRNQEIYTVARAFQRKGPIVRLGPNEISVNVINDGVSTVHNSGGGFEKTQWYDFFMNHGTRNTFSSLGREHASRRRRSANIYAKSFIQRSPHVRKIISSLLLERYMPIISKSSSCGTALNILDLDFAYGLDFVSAFIFGMSRSTNFIEDAEARDRWSATYLKSHPVDHMFWPLELPNLTRWLTKVGIPVVPKWCQEAHGDLDKWALQMVDVVEEAIANQPAEETVAGNCALLYSQLKIAMAKEQQNEGSQNGMIPSQQQRLELASECLDHLVATRDTFGVTFTFLLYEISRHPEIQRELQKELCSIPHPFSFPPSTDTPELPSPESLESLPLLHAVIKESLRLRNTGPSGNPRVTPGHRMTTIGPYENIPAGVRVSCFAWCLHRNGDVYPDPEEWLPERWLGDSADRKEREKWFWAWGSGSRGCLGKNLAMESKPSDAVFWHTNSKPLGRAYGGVVMRYAIAAIYTNFSTSIVNDEGFGRDGTFVTGSPGEELILKFERLGSGDIE